MTEDKVLITTRTGEPYQPSRIYFKVFKPKTVIRSFQKLRCMEFNPQANSWNWLYENEARKIRFETSYNKIDKQYRPLILGKFLFRGEDELILDVRSFDRLIKAIVFFEPHINRYAATITKLRVVNYLFDKNDHHKDEDLNPPFDRFFDQGNVTIPDVTEKVNAIQNIIETNQSNEEKASALRTFLEESAKKRLPEIEEIDLSDLGFGLEELPTMLAMRQAIAIQHWRGNTDFTEYDFFNQMMELISEEEE
jgi:hypothetical protein